MNRRSITGLVVFLALLSLTSGCTPPKPVPPKLSTSSATAPEKIPSDLLLSGPHLSETPSRWEYKVVKAAQDGEQELTKFLNDLSREGWEFVGQLQTKESYLVLRRTKMPRDYLRSKGEFLPPDPLGKEAWNPTTKEGLNTARLPPIRRPVDRSSAPTSRKDTRSTGLPRLGDNSGK